MRFATTLPFLLAASAVAQSGVWAQLPGVASPDGVGLDACYDSARDRIVALCESGSRAGEHWEFDGTAWQQLPTTNLGELLAVAYDSTRNRVIAVGADSSGTFRTFAYSGTWTDLAPVHAPAVAASDVEIVYDASRDRVVLYISQLASATAIGETWEFDGTDWTLRTHGGPTPRYATEMAYDPVRARTVMFSGITTSSPRMDETWEWDGVAWVEHIVPAPRARRSCAMSWHGGLGQVVVYGGSTGSTDLLDTWAWNGSVWTQIATSADPGARNAAAMAFDTARNRTVLAGSFGFATGTWEFTAQAPVQGTFATFGAGCAGSAGVPTLVSYQGDLPYTNETFSLRVHNVGASLLNVAFGVIGSSNTNWQQFSLPMSLAPFGFAGCTGYVSLDEVVPLGGPGASGSVSWDIAIPNDVTLAGGAFYVQALVLDPGSTPGGAIVSNAGVGVVGLR